MLNSSVIKDDDGFCSLLLDFNTTDKVNLQFFDTNDNLIFSEEFYKGNHDESIILGEYRTTPSPGTYHLKVYDANNKKIFENEFFYLEPNITIGNIFANWWLHDNTYYFVGLTMTLQNNGDIPSYPHNVDVSVGDKESSGLILPQVVMPHQSITVSSFLYLENISTGKSPLEISIQNSDDVTLSQATKAMILSDNTADLEYSWRYKKQYVLSLPDLTFLYDYYRGLERLILEDYAAYVFDRYDDQFVDFVAEQLLEINGFTEDVDIINFIASFIQSLTYAEDDENDTTCEYPRFPIEMLKDSQGDCEDKAICTAALLDSLGYDVALLRLPNHMAVGVHLDENLSSYDYYTENYYYLETTRNRWDVGRIPDEYLDNSNVTIHPISSRPILLHNWKNATRFSGSDGSDYVEIKILVRNLGRAAANNFEVTGAFYAQNDLVFNKEILSIAHLPEGESIIIKLKVHVPQDISTTLKTQIYLDDTMVHEKVSSSNFP